MITFLARMYDVSTQRFPNGESPRRYSFSTYDDTPSSQYPQRIIAGDDGTIRTDISSHRFDSFSTDNIGYIIEFEETVFLRDTSAHHIIRFYTSLSMDDNYIEWNPSNPYDLFVKSGSSLFLWKHCIYFDITNSNLNSRIGINIFIQASDKEDLLNDIPIWSGCIYTVNSTFTTYISYASYLLYGDVTYNSVPSRLQYTQNASVLKVYTSNTTFDTYKNGYFAAAIYMSVYSQVIYLIFFPAPTTFTTTLVPNIGGTVGPLTTSNYFDIGNCKFVNVWGWGEPSLPVIESSITPIDNCVYYGSSSVPYSQENINIIAKEIADAYHISVSKASSNIYNYLSAVFIYEEPDSDITPDNIPPTDNPPYFPDSDSPDPYYNPESDPESPFYIPENDPTSPSYNPTGPTSPYRPTSTAGGGSPLPISQPTSVLPPATPPSHNISSSFYTLFVPTSSQLDALATFLWSPAWTLDGFKKIFANPIDVIIGLMIMPKIVTPTLQKELYIGNIPSGVTMYYVSNQYVYVDCGTIKIPNYYRAYLDYDPYTKIDLYLPYIGTQPINADEVMGKDVHIYYSIDLLSSACVAFVEVDSTVLYNFTGMVGASIPIVGNDWSTMVNGVLSVVVAGAAVATKGTSPVASGIAAGVSMSNAALKQNISHGSKISSAAGLMGIQVPYVIITRPRQALPMDSSRFYGHPYHATAIMGNLSGFTKVLYCHLENIPATADEVKEIESLLKEGVYL